MWLLYLAIYPIPWLDGPPTLTALLASVAGMALFLAIYWHAFFRQPRSTVPHVIAMAAIGFALSPFGGAWSVFNVFAATTGARLRSRREAVLAVSAVLLTLVAFGVVFQVVWIAWVSGVFFSLLAAGGTLLHADLERRNRQLVATQDQVRILAASSERERIARDLHDLLGHTLTLVAVKADLATRLAERDPGAARTEMAQVATIAREALGEVRSAVTGMRAASLAAEMDRANAMLSAAGVQARVQSASATLDPNGEAVLAMVLRKAVTNVIRHAGASRCLIDLGVDASGLMSLCVTDDGAGGAIAEGSGLSGMRARLAAAGGALDVESGRGGTRLLAMLPAPNRPRSAA